MVGAREPFFGNNLNRGFSYTAPNPLPINLFIRGIFLYSKTIIKLPVKEKNNRWLPYSEKTGKFVYGDNITKWCNQLSK